MTEVKEMEKAIQDGSANPMEFKKKLAYAITAEHKGDDAAQKAQKYFEEVFQKRAAEEAEVPEVACDRDEVPITEALTEILKFTDSNSQAKRLVEQGAVYVDSQRISDKNATITVPETGILVKAGKKIAKLVKK